MKFDADSRVLILDPINDQIILDYPRNHEADKSTSWARRSVLKDGLKGITQHRALTNPEVRATSLEMTSN
jgi:hypothetical protein